MTQKPKSKRSKAQLIGGCISTPIVCFFIAYAILLFNNRPVSIDMPTTKMPNPNAYDDFARAGVLAQSMQHKSPFSMFNPTFSYAEFEAAAKDENLDPIAHTVLSDALPPGHVFPSGVHSEPLTNQT